MPVQGKIRPLGDSPRALIVKPSSLGDIVHSLPFLHAFKQKYPSSIVHWAVFRGLEGIIEGHKLIDSLIVIDKSRFKNPLALPCRLLSLRAELRENSYNVSIDLQGLFRSGLVSFLSGAPSRVGFSDARELSPFFYTDTVLGGKSMHAVDRYLKVAALIGCDISEIEFPMVHEEFSPPFDGEYAVLVPGARWRTKMWPAESFGKLASMLPVRSVVAGSGDDYEAGEKIASISGGRCINLAGKTTLRQLSGLMKNALFAVTNDTGPMHIAAALGVRVFAVFGPTNPLRTGPYGKGHVVITPELPCAPCYRRRCRGLECMRSISPEKVMSLISSNA